MRNILWNLLKNFLRKDIKIIKLRAKIFEKYIDVEIEIWWWKFD
jgi:hypothetical protein